MDKSWDADIRILSQPTLKSQHGNLIFFPNVDVTIKEIDGLK